MAITGYGVCTWIFGRQPLAETARKVRAMGYDGMELLGELEGQDLGAIKQTLRGAGLRVLSMTPANVDLAHPSVFVRQQAVDYYLRLLEWASELGAPLISCHGAVGRIRPLASQRDELQYLVESVGEVGQRAQSLGLRVALEHLNRYESHLLNTCADGLRFLDQVGLPNVGLHLDAYHMNIEEPDAAGALLAAGRRLLLFHAADSNRQGAGRGHTDLGALVRALLVSGYHGPVIMECTAPGPDPFSAIKDESSLGTLEVFLEESLARLKQFASEA